MDFEWTRTLERFIKGRLRNRSKAGVPLSLHGSQFVVDGILLAINDRYELHNESWTAVKNSLVSRWQALEVETKDVDSAALDLYLAWCVVDAVCKGAASPHIVSEIARDLPTMITNYLPMWEAETGDNERRVQRLTRVSEEHGPWYWDLLRSWRVYRVFTDAVWQAVEEATSSKLAALNAAGDSEGGSIAARAEGPVSGLHEASKRQRKARGHEAVQTALQDLYAVGKETCVYCGCQFDSEAALHDHHDFHVELMRTSGGGVITRLLNPKLESFLGYGGGHADGKYVSVHDLAVKVKRQHFRVTLAEKRGRELVYVEDAAEGVACEICNEPFTIASDPAGGRMYYDGAIVYFDKGARATIHAECLYK